MHKANSRDFDLANINAQSRLSPRFSPFKRQRIQKQREKKFSEINVHNQEDGRSVKDICKWSWKFNEIYAI